MTRKRKETGERMLRMAVPSVQDILNRLGKSFVRP